MNWETYYISNGAVEEKTGAKMALYWSKMKIKKVRCLHAFRRIGLTTPFLMAEIFINNLVVFRVSVLNASPLEADVLFKQMT